MNKEKIILKVASIVLSVGTLAVNLISTEQGMKEMEKRVADKVRNEVLQDVMNAMKQEEAI